MGADRLHVRGKGPQKQMALADVRRRARALGSCLLQRLSTTGEARSRGRFRPYVASGRLAGLQCSPSRVAWTRTAYSGGIAPDFHRSSLFGLCSRRLKLSRTYPKTRYVSSVSRRSSDSILILCRSSARLRARGSTRCPHEPRPSGSGSIAAKNSDIRVLNTNRRQTYCSTTSSDHTASTFPLGSAK